MARLINNKLLFIHVAKTGGTFFREQLNIHGIPNIEVGAKHDSFYTVLRENPELEFKECFGFVRHPVTWYRSRWAFAKMSYFKEKLKFNPEAQKHWMAKVWDDNLNKFIINTLDEYPFGIATNYFNEMLGFLNFSKCHIHRFEDLHQITEFQIYKCGKTIKISDNPKKLLDSSHIHQEIGSQVREQIMLVEKELVKKFNYE